MYCLVLEVLSDLVVIYRLITFRWYSVEPCELMFGFVLLYFVGGVVNGVFSG